MSPGPVAYKYLREMSENERGREYSSRIAAMSKYVSPGGEEPRKATGRRDFNLIYPVGRLKKA